MITYLQALPIGDAVRGLIAPPEGTSITRILRKVADTFTGPTDPAAAVIYEGDELSFMDIAGLVNGTVYYYRAYHLVGASWIDSPTLSATPAATANLIGPDPLTLIRDRFEAGLKAEVVAGRLTHEDGYIECLKAPPMFAENAKWPKVSVHLRADQRNVSGVGEIISADAFDGVWTDGDGYLSRGSIDVVGWATNAGVRNDLYLAIKKVLIGNFPVFYDAGMLEVEGSFTNPDDVETYSAPVYMTVCSISFLAPNEIDATTDPVVDVTVSAFAA